MTGIYKIPEKIMIMKGIKVFGIGILILVTLFGSGYAISAMSSGNGFSAKDSFKTAGEFVINSPTYVFDGFNLILKETSPIVCVTEPCSNSWVFTFSFVSSHAGYGDRTDQAVAQSLTDHVAIVTVEEGQITSAVLDEKWDMADQKLLG